MAFAYSEMSILVVRDPAAAHAKLIELFEMHAGDVRVVAAALSVNWSTVFRWLSRLAAQGFSDPRQGKRGTPGRKPTGRQPAPVETRVSIAKRPPRLAQPKKARVRKKRGV